MGITIHYHGQLEDPGVLPDLLMAARHFCFQRHWKYHDVDDRILGTLERWIPAAGEVVRTESTPVDDTLRGILISPHKMCETVVLTFNQHGMLCFYLPEPQPGRYWEEKYLSTKTQFAPLDIHISICELLHLVQDRFFPSLEVTDEGDYFQTNDPLRLAQNIATLGAAMDNLEAAMKDQDTGQDAVDGAEEGDDKPRRERKRKIRVERGKQLTVGEPMWKRGHGESANKN